jgi:hypothetical protein
MGEQLSSPLELREDADLLLDLPLSGGDVSIASPQMLVSQLILSYLLASLNMSFSAFRKRFEFCWFLFLFLVVCFEFELDGFGKLDLDVVDGLEEVFADVPGCDEHAWLEDVCLSDEVVFVIYFVGVIITSVDGRGTLKGLLLAGGQVRVVCVVDDVYVLLAALA